MTESDLESDASTDGRLDALRRLLEIVDRLREPGGCPWDREQTVASMAVHLIEEAHELVEAVDAGGDSEMIEEAGDVLMVLAMICRIASEEDRFDLADAAQAVADKLVRRHPHVFGEAEADDPEQVLRQWEEIKAEERRAKGRDESALAGVPRSLPALQRAARTCERAVATGFRWASARGALAKVREEIAELCEVLEGVDLDRSAVELGAGEALRVEEELGDVLLATAFLGEYLGVDPERACRTALGRFEERFRFMEGRFGGSVAERSLEDLMAAWDEAKRRFS
ncbi:MAG: nucleoside triphosphate pyrophosphohydrolase [Planctomycetes bacterium]|jgi:MazG family protein|nr:nucleoside triphosphate pyrophosphohydrolase [Planctomycetota bacterium]MDP6409713.1 nucleoside triphosphate pyrophosphohydrolase [Planctomycetota bacterium]